ncbi:hypothetical protein L596_013132 [Steinernema carpocapsae]|uniref:Uncharacterized protein n=1 Tax=Steinernema carpocapsae TaxID=34508 RepID=A0A4U5NZ73_STECR|nr:hypothetical protein L596_013132 [Steinernema carpocapsae]
MLKFAKEKNLHIENWQEELQSGADLKPFLKDLVEDNNPAWRHGTLKLKTDRSKNPPQELVIEAFRMFITDACFQDFLIKTLEFEIGYLPRHIPSTKETVERVKDHPLLVYRLDPDMWTCV